MTNNELFGYATQNLRNKHVVIQENTSSLSNANGHGRNVLLTLSTAISKLSWKRRWKYISFPRDFSSSFPSMHIINTRHESYHKKPATNEDSKGDEKRPVRILFFPPPTPKRVTLQDSKKLRYVLIN